MNDDVSATTDLDRTLAQSPYRYRAPLPPPRFNMARYCIGRSAATYPDKKALLVFDTVNGGTPAEVFTYRELEDAILRVAAALKARGLRPGDRLLLRLPNTSAFPLLFFGAIAAGIVPIPTSSQLTSSEAAFLAHDAGVAAVAASDDFDISGLNAGEATLRIFRTAAIDEMLDFPVQGTYAPTSANDPAYMVYTSGTTAHPKGVVHAHRAAWGRQPMYDGWYGLTSADRMLHAGAFNWTYTLGTGLTDPWAIGATAIIYTGEKTPDIWPRLIAASGATLFAAVPGVFRQILKYARRSREPHEALGPLGALRHGLIAGETPPPELFSDWKEATGLELYEALGMSEISTFVSASPSVPRRPGTIGKAQPGRSIAILPDADDGEQSPETPLPPGCDGMLAVHRTDPALMLGYWNRPEEERCVWRGEWFIGGDRARMDADGYVTHLGRANDVMKVLGYRVAPQEVEAVLLRHPEVVEAACFQHEVSPGVSIMVACLVPDNPDRPPAAEAIAAFAAEYLAGYKRPRKFLFVPSLPRTPNGKIRRADLAVQSRDEFED